jgi:hypothetical protein
MKFMIVYTAKTERKNKLSDLFLPFNKMSLVKRTQSAKYDFLTPSESGHHLTQEMRYCHEVHASSAADAITEKAPPAPAEINVLALTALLLISVGTSVSSSPPWPVRPLAPKPQE